MTPQMKIDDYNNKVVNTSSIGKLYKLLSIILYWIWTYLLLSLFSGIREE